MAAPVFMRHFTQDIQQKVEARHCGGLMFTGDALSDTISVSLYDGGEAYAVSGTVTCNVIRADGATVPVVGSLSDNTVSATLPEACFAVPGPLIVIMKITGDNTTTTVLKAVFTVDVGETGTIVDPGTIIPDVTALISAIETAVASIPADYSDLLAAIAKNYTDLTFPVSAGTYCWYGGTLYRAKVDIPTSESWTAAHWLAAVIGTDLAELKSAIGNSDSIKAALLACLEKVAWIDDDGQDYYDNLYDALYESTWSVKNTLSHCLSSNSAQEIVKNSAYSATITAANGYTLTGATVVIMMGNDDITSAAYNAGVISIASVTAPLRISVTAAQKTLDSISAVYSAPSTEFALSDTTLDDFKPYLTVTATYADASTAVIASDEYTLSGTLAYGSNTITVEYGSKTTTFTATIDTLYKLLDMAPTTLTRADDNTRSSVVSVSNGVVSVTGNNNTYMYIWMDGTAHTYQSSTEWFSMHVGDVVKFEVYDITWQAPAGSSQQLQPKWTTTQGNNNLMSATFDISSGSSGTDGESSYETDSYASDRIIGSLNVHWSNLPAAGGSISFKIRLTVNNVRYF